MSASSHTSDITDFSGQSSSSFRRYGWNIGVDDHECCMYRCCRRCCCGTRGNGLRRPQFLNFWGVHGTRAERCGESTASLRLHESQPRLSDQLTLFALVSFLSGRKRCLPGTQISKCGFFTRDLRIRTHERFVNVCAASATRTRTHIHTYTLVHVLAPSHS